MNLPDYDKNPAVGAQKQVGDTTFEWDGEKWIIVSNFAKPATLTTKALIESKRSYSVGEVIITTGYETNGDGGGAMWKRVGNIIEDPNQTPAMRLDGTLTTGSGLVFKVVVQEGKLSAKAMGSYHNGIDVDDGAVQAAINVVKQEGGVVLLDAPNWALEGVDILSGHVLVAGLGRYATNVKYLGNPATTSTVAAFSFGQPKSGSGALTPVSGCGLMGMTIDGNRSGGAVGGGVRVTVFDGLVLYDVEVKDCYGNYGFGIVGTGSTPRNNIGVYDCAAFRCGADGLDIKAGLMNAVIENFESAGHADETGGDSVGLDIRGQYIKVINPKIYDCIEFGLRVRINSGEEDGDGNWDTTEKAKVNIINPVLYNNRDNIIISAPKNSVANCVNLVSTKATRYGLSTGGEGVVNIIGGSISECLSGVLPDPTGELNMTNLHIIDNTQDGIVGGNCKNIKMVAGSIKRNGRYGVTQSGTPSDAKWRFIGVDIDSNLTNYANLSATSDGDISFTDCDITGAVSRGVQVAESPMLLRIQGGSIKGNSTNIHSINNNSKINNVDGLVTKAKGNASFLVDSVGKKTIAVTHGLSFTPSLQDISISIGRSTVVDDYTISLFRVVGTSSTIFTVEIYVDVASASSGAEALLLWKSDVKQ